MKKKTPRTKEKEVRIREIQEAAKKIFFKKGFRAATIDDIAAKAGTSKGLVYLHFKNKEDLYISLMMPGLEVVTRLLAGFEKKLDQDEFRDPKAFLMEYGHILLKYYEYDPEGFRVYRASQLENLFSNMSSQTANRINQIGKENYAISRRIMRKAIDSGLIPPVDVVKWADISWALFQGIVEVELEKVKVTQKDHIKETILYAFSLLVNGLLSERDPRDAKINKKTRR